MPRPIAQPSKYVKERTGCEQCKRRKVKCDKGQPKCSRCLARGEICTGNFRFDTWQIERPWVNQVHGPSVPGPALENEALRYWYDKVCLIMALFPPPTNPLSYPLTRLLQHSRALRHTVQSISNAHRAGFSPQSLIQTLQERNLAIVSLQGEVSRVLSPISISNRQIFLRTLILSSLFLCLSSSWVDPSGKEAGLEFLYGVRGIIPLLTEVKPSDSFSFYILGFYLYMESFSSYLVPLSQQKLPDASVLRILEKEPFDRAVHPVAGIATTIFPILIEIGHYYRQMVEVGIRSPAYEQRMRQRLVSWQPPEASPRVSQLVQLAEGYRSIGRIMLYQAKRVADPLDLDDRTVLLQDTLSIMTTAKHLPRHDTLINWLGPFLVIAGSELPATFPEERNLVILSSQSLASFTGVTGFGTNMDFIQEVWQRRDRGEEISWLQAMLSHQYVLPLA